MPQPRNIANAVTLLLMVTLSLSAQSAPQQMMQVESITVAGTRLPKESVIRLSGIKLHDKVNDITVNKACHNITATGLVRSVDYAYDVYPDRAGVTLVLTIKDEEPLLPASIKPQPEEQTSWSALQSTDPIFTRNLPPTEKALAFYAKNLDRYLHNSGRDDEYVAANVISDSTGKLIGIVFEIHKYKTSQVSN